MTALIAFWSILNIVSSISVVVVNKWIYRNLKFPNMTLTCLHFVVCFAGLLICRFLGVFRLKHIPVTSVLDLCVSFVGFVALTNLSLQFNTVGTYQVIKVLTTPCIMLIQTYIYNRSFSWPIKLTLIPISIGVFLNSYYDVQFNFVGILFALCGVLVTSVYQVLVGEKQSELNVNSMQLLFYQAPISAVLLSTIIPFFEPVVAPGGLLHSFQLFFTIQLSNSAQPIHVHYLSVILVSAIIAFFVNLSTFWIIGNLSPVTYNMIGHTKFCLVLVVGFLTFHEPVGFLQIVGVLLTLGGVGLYSWLKLAGDQLQLPFSIKWSLLSQKTDEVNGKFTV